MSRPSNFLVTEQAARLATSSDFGQPIRSIRVEDFHWDEGVGDVDLKQREVDIRLECIIIWQALPMSFVAGDDEVLAGRAIEREGSEPRNHVALQRVGLGLGRWWILDLGLGEDPQADQLIRDIAVDVVDQNSTRTLRWGRGAASEAGAEQDQCGHQ